MISDEIKAITVEDPVEYHVPGLNQIQVNHKIGLNFAAGLRAILRHDPDVVMVGEIRDKETAETAVQASADGPPRLLDACIPNDSPWRADAACWRWASSPTSSRVPSKESWRSGWVRKVCQECGEAYTPAAADLPRDLELPAGAQLKRGGRLSRLPRHGLSRAAGHL